MRKKVEGAPRSSLWVTGLGISILSCFWCSSGGKIGSPVAVTDAAVSPLPLNVLSAQEKEQGWVLLFDGETFGGWRGIGRADIPQGHWIIEDGAIKKVASGEVPRQEDGQPLQGGDLITDQTFEDFELSLEWKIGPGGNSGIKYNVSEEISRAYAPGGAAIGFEYQILDDIKNPDAKNGPKRTAAALYDLIAPAGKVLRPVGEYNEARIIFFRNHGEHWLNAAKVLEYDLGTRRLRGLVAVSKYRDIPDFAAKRQGHIVLQDHGDVVWFRNIKIRDLKRT
jgi:hypothetical protein